MSVCLLVCLSVCLPACWSVCLSVIPGLSHFPLLLSQSSTPTPHSPTATPTSNRSIPTPTQPITKLSSALTALVNRKATSEKQHRTCSPFMSAGVTAKRAAIDLCCSLATTCGPLAVPSSNPSQPRHNPNPRDKWTTLLTSSAAQSGQGGGGQQRDASECQKSSAGTDAGRS